MEQINRIGMDPSKQYFQLHGVNGSEEPILRKKLRRSQMVTFFEKLPATLVAIEACSGSHHWSPFRSPPSLRRFFACIDCC